MHRRLFTCAGLALGVLLYAGFASASSAAGVLDCGDAAYAASAGQAALAPDPLEYVAPSRNFKTLHVSLDLDLDLAAQRIGGSVTHTLEALRANPQAFELNCVGLEVAKVEVDGRPARFDYPVAGQQATSWLEYSGAGESASLLRVYPPQPLARGQQVRLQIWYAGAPKDGLHFMTPEAGDPRSRPEVWSQGEGENNRYWIPCFDYPNEKATYDGTFRVDNGYYVLSNGRLDSTSAAGGKTQYHWVLDQPQVTYLIMVAAAKYEVYSDHWRGREVSYLMPPGTGEATARRAYGLTPDMLDFFSDVTGIEYPYDKYAQVVVQNFIFGGMENTTATVMTDRSLFDERAALTRDNEGLVAHELAHQWWGDMVTCRDWSQMWLNEGFATYFQQLYREHHDGADEFIYDLDGAHQATLGADRNDPRPVVTQFFNRRDAQNSANVYVKGASVLNMLRRYVGDDVFFDTLHRYGTERQWQTVDTTDLMRAFRDASGENLDWFFQQWIYLAGHPDLRVTKYWDAGRKLLTLTVEQTQKVTEAVPLFRLPLDVEFTCEGQPQQYRILVDKQRQDFYFSLPSDPQMVLVDKGGHTLKTLDFRRSQGELKFQLEHGDTWGRIEAARALGEIGPDEAVVGALRSVLLDANAFWGLRKEAARALARNRTQAAIDALLAGLSLPTPKVRLACTEAAGDLPLNGAVETRLRELADTDPAYAVRAAAVDSLVRLKSGLAYAASLAAIGQDSDNDGVRNAGLRGLAALEKPEALAKVRALAAPGNPRSHRHQALDTFGQLSKQLRLPAEKAAAARFLLAQLDDWYPNTRSAVMAALVNVSDKSAVDPLKAAGVHDPLERLRKQAGEAARTIETQTEKKVTTDDLSVQLKALQDELTRVKDELADVRQRVPEPRR
jgi:aminopeptidase N